MSLNTYPYNQFPASTDKLDEAHNAELQAEIDTVKSGLTNLDNEVNGDATVYPYADVITIPDAVPANLADCTVKIEPDQDLHGYGHPWVGGAGKNKLPMTVDGIKAANTSGTWSGNVYTENSVKYTVLLDNDGNVIGVNIDGVAPTATGMILATNQTFDTDCLLSKGYSSGSGAVSLALLNNAGSGVAVEATSIGATVEAGNYGNVRIRVNANITVSNVNIYPMIRLATETDATFAPYTNICPITGHTEASVEVTDGDETTKTYTIALGDTIYGGTVDFDSGVMTVTHTLIEFDGTEEWRLYGSGSASAYAMALTKGSSLQNPDPLYCISNSLDVIGASATYGNYDAFISTNSPNDWIAGIRTITTPEDWKTYLASNPVQLCYPLATHTTIQLTPQQIQLLKGQNTLTASTGDISVTVNGVSGAIGAVQTQANATDVALAELVADIAEQLPTAPTTDGAYVLTVTVADGTPTYSWESAT